MQECVRIYSSIDEVRELCPHVDDDKLAYRHASDSNRMVVCQEPRDIGLVTLWGMQHVVIDNSFENRLRPLHKLSSEQVIYQAQSYQEWLRGKWWNIVPSNIIIPVKWQWRMLRPKYWRNFLSLLDKTQGPYKRYILLDSPKPRWWFPWSAIDKYATVIFRCNKSLMLDVDKVGDRYVSYCERNEALRYAISVPYLKYNDHQVYAPRLAADAVMTGRLDVV